LLEHFASFFKPAFKRKDARTQSFFKIFLLLKRYPDFSAVDKSVYDTVAIFATLRLCVKNWCSKASLL
jgi:hypothetical protein